MNIFCLHYVVNFDLKNVRMRIDRHGNFSYCHQVDTSFDVSDFVLDIKNQKSWRDVYWQLWGIITCLHCSRCGEIFQGCELASCRYHPEEIVYIEGARGSGGGVASEFSAMGEYTCCRARVARFEPVTSDKVNIRLYFVRPTIFFIDNILIEE